MWTYRTRQGKRNKEEDRGLEENVIEVHDPKEGTMVYRPSSCVMPARPLGVPLELPIITPIVKKEIEEDNFEDESDHFSVYDATVEAAVIATSKMIDAPTESASDENVQKIKIKIEPNDDVPNDISPSLVNDNIKSSPVNERSTTELNQNSPGPHKDAEADSSEKKMTDQNHLQMWDLATMFADVSSENMEDQSSSASVTASKPTTKPFKLTYLNYCLPLKRSDVEECLEYLKSSYESVKKNPLFCLEVAPQKNINSTVVQKTVVQTAGTVSEKTVSVKRDITTEDLKRILTVSNAPSISSDQNNSQSLQSNVTQSHQLISDCSEQKETINIKKEAVSPKKGKLFSHSTEADIASGQSNSQLPQSNIPNKQLSDCSGHKETVNIKKEPVSPKKSDPYGHLIDAGNKDASIKPNSVLSKNQSVSEPVRSEIAPENFITPKKSPTKRKRSDDVELDGRTVVIKKEPISPERKFNNFGESSGKRKNSFDIDVNAAKKHIKKVVPVENLEKTGPASCNLVIDSKSVKVFEAKRFEETSNVVAPKQTVQGKKISHNLDNSLSKLKINKDDRKRISSLSEDKNKSNSIPKSCNVTSAKNIPVIINRFNGGDLNAIKNHINQETVVSVENFAANSTVEKAPAINTNQHLSPRAAKSEPQIFSNLDYSSSKSKITKQSNGMDVSRVSFSPTIKDKPSVIPQSDSTTSGKRIPVIDRFLPSNKDQRTTMTQSPDFPLQETSCYGAPKKKRILSATEYLQRHKSLSSNSNVSKCSQESLLPPLDQMSQMDNYYESFARDPRLKKNVLSTPSVSDSSSSHAPPREIGQNAYSRRSSLSHTSFKSSISREKSSPQEPLEMHPISLCDDRNQNVFELRRDNSSVIKNIREKIGCQFILPSEVTGLILEWNVSWLEEQKRTSVVPPIIHDKFIYPKVKSSYSSVESYYNTYLPLHLLSVWISMYKSWERNYFLPDSILECREKKATYVKFCCSMKFNLDSRKKFPRTEDILICEVIGQPKRLFGKVVRVESVQPIGRLGDVTANFDIICAENFDVRSSRLMKLQKLINIRQALHTCGALRDLNPFMRPALLNPKNSRSQIEVIFTQSFASHNFVKSNMDKIERSVNCLTQSITLVHTLKASESYKAIHHLVPIITKKGGLIFLCMKDEATFFEMAADLRKYDEPVLAIKEEDVPNLPLELADNTVKRMYERGKLDQCHIVLVLMSAMFVGELKNRLHRDSRDISKNAICLILEAQKFLETETALILENNFRSLVLLGREGLIENIEARLKRQDFDKSMFKRICESFR